MGTCSVSGTIFFATLVEYGKLFATVKIEHQVDEIYLTFEKQMLIQYSATFVNLRCYEARLHFISNTGSSSTILRSPQVEDRTVFANSGTSGVLSQPRRVVEIGRGDFLVFFIIIYS